MDPLTIAAECLREERGTLAAPERIKNGLTNESWLVRGAQDTVVVRLSNHKTYALQINRTSEAQVLQAVAAAGIGAPVLLCAPDRHVLVTRYVSGRAWASRDVRTLANLQRIADVLRKLHALPVPQGVQALDLMESVRGYWNTLLERGLAAKAGTPKMRERARENIADLAADIVPCLCHNDVHHLNIIDAGRVWLIDWEYAAVGDPYFDLASVCCYHELSDDLRRCLLRAYWGYYSAESFDRLQRMCWVFNYIRDLWFAVREME
jgi:thiamine kinase